MNSKKLRIARIAFPFAPNRKECLDQAVLSNGTTVMRVTEEEMEFLQRMSGQMKRSSSPIWMEVQDMGEVKEAA